MSRPEYAYVFIVGKGLVYGIACHRKRDDDRHTEWVNSNGWGKILISSRMIRNTAVILGNGCAYMGMIVRLCG